MAPNHGWDPLRYILWPMGSHWGQKMGQNRKNLPCPKIRIFYFSMIINFGKKSHLRLWRQITVGTPEGPSWGQWGPFGAKKWVKTVKNYHAPKFEFFTIPRSLILAKIRIQGYGAKSRWGPPRVHLGADGSKKWDKTVKNYHAVKFKFFTTPRSLIWAEIEFTVMAPNQGWDPLGSILGPMGSHWGQKMGQNRIKLPCPKIRIFDYSAVIDLGKKSNLRLWRQIKVGIP